MEILEVKGVRLAGIAACVPSGVVPNDPKVVAATGISARRIVSDGVTGLDLCLMAACRVLADTGARPDEFGAILSVSFTQETRMPSTAAQAQARLGFPKNSLAFDVLQACAGYGYGLYLAALLAQQTRKKVLLLDGDRQSAFLRTDDPAMAPLLSDGGSATIVESENGEEEGGRRSDWRFAFRTDGEKGDALRLVRDGTIEMDGFGVFRFVATDVVSFLKEFASVTLPSDLSSPSFFVPHQPNVYMVRQLAKSIGLLDRTLLSADRFGNLSSASIPTTIVAHAASFASGPAPISILLAGFGGGLAISAGLITLEKGCILSLVS